MRRRAFFFVGKPVFTSDNHDGTESHSLPIICGRTIFCGFVGIYKEKENETQ